MNEDDTDRLLSEKELIRLAKERFGLTASKVIQMITDCPEASAMQVRIPGEKEVGIGTHNRRFEDKAEVAP